MGFASGFAEAFGQSYGQARTIRARKEESEYEWRMKGLFDEKERRIDLEKRAKAAQATAKSIAERTGAPLKEVYNRLKDGGDASSVQEWAEGGDWSGVKYANGSLDIFSIPDPVGTGAAAAESPVNNSGTNVREVEGEDYTYRPKPKVMKPDEQKDSLIRERSLLQDDDPRAVDIDAQLSRWGQANSLVNPRQGLAGRTAADLEAEGLSPIEGIAVVDGKPTPKLLLAQPDGSFIDANTREPVEQARRVTKPEQESLDKITSSADTQAVVQQREKMQGMADSLRLGSEIVTMANSNPNLTSSFTGSVAGVVSTLRREAGTSLSLLDEALKNEKGIDPSLIKQAEAEVNSIDLSALDVVDRFAAEQGLYEAKKNIMVFKVAQALGQTGNAFSDTDFKRIENGLFAGKGKDIQRSISEYLGREIKNVNSGASLINQFNTANEQHFKKYGYRPIEEPIAPTVEEFIATQDPEAQEGLKMFTSAQTQGSGTPNDPVRTNPNQARTTKSGVSYTIRSN